MGRRAAAQNWFVNVMLQAQSCSVESQCSVNAQDDDDNKNNNYDMTPS